MYALVPKNLQLSECVNISVPDVHKAGGPRGLHGGEKHVGLYDVPDLVPALWSCSPLSIAE